ncbi:MAG: hypothetical protein GY838_12940 [bacterium]|nr:hypothetical protein [bacterium]
MTARESIIIADDLATDHRMDPETREKIRAHYDRVFGAFALPKEVLVLEGSAARATTSAALSLFHRRIWGRR